MSSQGMVDRIHHLETVFRPTRRAGWRGDMDALMTSFRGYILSLKGARPPRYQWAATLVYVLLAWRRRLTRQEWALSMLAIGLFHGSETTNTALEALADAVDRRHNPQIGRAKDMAAGIVFIRGACIAVMIALLLWPERRQRKQYARIIGVEAQPLSSDVSSVGTNQNSTDGELEIETIGRS